MQLTITEEQFLADSKTSPVTAGSDLCNETKGTAQKLLNHYVKDQGLTLSQVGAVTLIEVIKIQ